MPLLLPRAPHPSAIARRWGTLGSLALAGALPLGARAQADFRPGYVVQPAGDTLHGEVDYRDARFNAAQCRFRPAATAQARDYRPTELRAYGLPAEHKRYCPLQPEAGGPAYFAEVLASGPATLYYLRDAERLDHYYVQAPQFAPAELIHRRVLLPEQRIMQEQNTYRLTLTQALAGCAPAQALLPHLPYTAEALARAVRTFNQCQGAAEPESAAPARPRRPAQLGLVLGGQLAAAHFQYAGQVNDNQALDYGTSLGYALGLSAELPLTALSRKLSLAPALLLTHQQHQLEQSSGPAAGRYTLEATYLRLPLLVRYTLPLAGAQPYFELGPTLAYALRLRNQLGSLAASAPAPKDFYPDTQRALQEGLAAGLGVQVPYAGGRRASVGVRAELDNGWMGALGFSSSTTRVFALLTFHLTK